MILTRLDSNDYLIKINVKHTVIRFRIGYELSNCLFVLTDFFPFWRWIGSSGGLEVLRQRSLIIDWLWRWNGNRFNFFLRILIRIHIIMNRCLLRQFLVSNEQSNAYTWTMLLTLTPINRTGFVTISFNKEIEVWYKRSKSFVSLFPSPLSIHYTLK